MPDTASGDLSAQLASPASIIAISALSTRSMRPRYHPIDPGRCELLHSTAALVASARVCFRPQTFGARNCPHDDLGHDRGGARGEGWRVDRMPDLPDPSP